MIRRHPILLLAVALLALPVALAQQAVKSLPVVAPAEAGMDAALLARVPERMQKAVEAKQTSGVVTLVARQGKIVSLEAVGYSDIEKKTPMAKDSIFAIASMTKPIVSAALMILVDEGKVGLDDPVAKYIPEFKDVALKDGAKPKQAITVKHVLTHTAGLGGSQQNDGSLKETAEKLAKRPLDFEPGAKWQYSPGITVAGRIVEVASGKPLDEFLAEKVFRPLGMADTTFRLAPEQLKRLVKLYQPSKDKQSLEAIDHWLVKEQHPNPSGGLFSTAGDLAKFYQMVLNGGELDGKRVLSRKAVEQMTSIQTGDHLTGFTPGNGWGLGWCVVRKPQGVSQSLSEGSHGHGGAFGTQGWIDPKRQMIYVLLIQRTNFGNADGSDLRAALHDLAVQAIK